MVRAPWNRETQGGLAIIIGPTADPAARKSFALLEPLTPAFRNGTRECRRPPLLARQHRPAGSNRTATRVHPSAHDARMRAPPLLRPKLGKNERARRISQIMSRQEATTVPVFQGPPKQRSGMPQAVSTPLR